MNLNFNELCSVFEIDSDIDSCAFVNFVDLKRKEYKVSQDNYCKMVGISRSFYSQCKKGSKGVSDENKTKMLLELARIKELSYLEENAARMTISSNTSRGLNKYSLESSVSENDVIREIKEGLWRTVQAKQKLKRNAQYFQPSIEASVDKITLFVKLTSSVEALFLKAMERFGIVSGNTRYTHNARYKSGKVTEYRDIWQYEGSDCKVHVQYMFFDKKIGVDVREVKVEFNPNKWDVRKNEMLIALAPFLSKNPRIKEFDICKDYYGFSDANIIMPKELFEGGGNAVKVFSDDDAKTIYFGDKNKTVNLMIYDKRKEILKKDNKDIGYNCLRAETRYKLKPGNEYRVKLSDVDKIKLPLKTYSCQAHMLEVGDIDKDVKAEDRIIIKAILSGALNLYGIVDIDKDVAIRINSYLEKIYIETLNIGYADVCVALNSFVFKYLECIDMFYNIGELEGLSEVWKIKNIENGFEVVGAMENWECLDDAGYEVEGVSIFNSMILDRDKDF